MDVSGMLNTTCTVSTLTTTQDAIGGVVESYAVRLSGIPCRVRALSGNEVPALGSDRQNSTHRIYMAPTTDALTITDKDRITSASGRVYDVTFPNDVDDHGFVNDGAGGGLLQIDAEVRKNG